MYSYGVHNLLCSPLWATCVQWDLFLPAAPSHHTPPSTYTFAHTHTTPMLALAGFAMPCNMPSCSLWHACLYYPPSFLLTFPHFGAPLLSSYHLPPSCLSFLLLPPCILLPLVLVPSTVVILPLHCLFMHSPSLKSPQPTSLPTHFLCAFLLQPFLLLLPIILLLVGTVGWCCCVGGMTWALSPSSGQGLLCHLLLSLPMSVPSSWFNPAAGGLLDMCWEDVPHLPVSVQDMWAGGTIGGPTLLVSFSYSSSSSFSHAFPPFSLCAIPPPNHTAFPHPFYLLSLWQAWGWLLC